MGFWRKFLGLGKIVTVFSATGSYAQREKSKSPAVVHLAPRFSVRNVIRALVRFTRERERRSDYGRKAFRRLWRERFARYSSSMTHGRGFPGSDGIHGISGSSRCRRGARLRLSMNRFTQLAASASIAPITWPVSPASSAIPLSGPCHFPTSLWCLIRRLSNNAQRRGCAGGKRSVDDGARRASTLDERIEKTARGKRETL